MWKNRRIFNDVCFSNDCGKIVMTSVVYSNNVGIRRFVSDAVAFKRCETFVVIDSLKVEDASFFDNLIVA